MSGAGTVWRTFWENEKTNEPYVDIVERELRERVRSEFDEEVQRVLTTFRRGAE